jgi:hypothetical protein
LSCLAPWARVWVSWEHCCRRPCLPVWGDPFVPPSGWSDTDATRHPNINELKVLAMLPVHRNVIRFLGEFVSTVPDPMFDALTPDLKELGACLRRASTHRCVRATCTYRCVHA